MNSPRTNAALVRIPHAPFAPARRGSHLQPLDALLPVATVEVLDPQRAELDAVEAAHVHVDPVRVRTRHVEARHAAVSAEMVLRGHRAEAVGREIGLAREQAETVAGNDQVEIGLAAADR